MSTLEGKLVANNMKVGIVVARFNEFITNKLLGGAMDGLLRHDVKEEDITEHNRIAMKQACAAIGQSRLMMTYQRIFSEYNQVTAQILMT